MTSPNVIVEPDTVALPRNWLHPVDPRTAPSSTICRVASGVSAPTVDTVDEATSPSMRVSTIHSVPTSGRSGSAILRSSKVSVVPPPLTTSRSPSSRQVGRRASSSASQASCSCSAW